jgi:hypothetical protein
MGLAILFSLLLVPPLSHSEADPCAEYKIGERRAWFSERGYVGIPYRQEVTRLDENTHQLRFYVKFVADTNYTGSESPADLDSIYRRKVEECLEEFNPKLKAIDDQGKIQKIRLVLNKDPRDTHASIPLWIIKIGDKGYDPRASMKTRNFQRAHSGAYPSDVSCQTVVHELMHLGGLVDEYDENSTLRNDIFVETNQRAQFSCRVLGPRTSLMNNEYLSLGPTSRFPLQPGHIKALLYPACAEKNETYFRCAKQAYSHEKCVEIPGCTLGDNWLRK